MQKVRSGERSRERVGEDIAGSGTLDDLNEAAMSKEDPDQLKALFEEHRQEYCKDRAAAGEGDEKRRKLQDIEDEALKESDPDKLDGLRQVYRIDHKSLRSGRPTRSRCEKWHLPPRTR